MAFPEPFFRWRPHPWHRLDTGPDAPVAVLVGDAVHNEVRDVSDIPAAIIARLEHYFLTHKYVPGGDTRVEIPEIYGREHALEVVNAAMADYEDHYGS